MPDPTEPENNAEAVERQLHGLSADDRRRLREHAYHQWRQRSEFGPLFPPPDPLPDSLAERFCVAPPDNFRLTLPALEPYLAAETLIEAVDIFTPGEQDLVWILRELCRVPRDRVYALRYLFGPLLAAGRSGVLITRFLDEATHSEFWQSYPALLAALPELPLSAIDVLSIADAVTRRARQDGAFAGFEHSLQEAIRRNPAVGPELLRIVLNSDAVADRLPLLRSTILAMHLTPQYQADAAAALSELYASQDPSHRAVAAAITGPLAIADRAMLASALDALLETTQDRSIVAAASALHELTTLLRQYPDTGARIESVLLAFMRDTRPEIRLVVARTSFRLLSSSSADTLARTLLPALTDTDPTQAGAIYWLAASLTVLAQHDPNLCLETLTGWCRAHPSGADITRSDFFLNPIITLIHEHPDTLLNFVVDWMINGGPFSRHAREVLADLRLYQTRDTPEGFPPSALRGHAQTEIRILINELGQGLIDPRYGCAYLLSIGEHATLDADLTTHLVEVLGRHCEQYPDTTRPMLLAAEASSNEALAAIAKAAREYIDQGILRLPSLPVPVELRSSPARLREFARVSAVDLEKTARRVRAEDPGRTPLSNLFKTVPIARGHRTFLRTPTGFSTPQGFGTIRHEMEIPRLEYVDPIGALYYRLILREENNRLRASRTPERS